MTTVTLQFPDDVFSALRRSPEEFGRELRRAAAILWYQRGEVSQEKAAQVAGLSRTQFLLELARTRSSSTSTTCSAS
jgi:predicted HTH domain antitoxin